MADNYFLHHPTISYSNTTVRNILSRVVFSKDNDTNFYTYHPYTIVEGDRADMLAYLYYGDPGYDWVIYFSNIIVDPYFEWPLDSRSFKRFIETKYGSITNARSKIKFYRNNYINDTSSITTPAYSALSEKQKNFWVPVIGNNGQIIEYQRKRQEIIYNTNKTLSLSVSVVGNTQYTVDEQVKQTSNSVITALGSVKFSNSSVVIVDDIQGSFSNTYNLVGVTSGANSTVSLVETLSTSIDSTIQNYFIPVTFYEYEEELNEQRKNIRLLDTSYVSNLEEKFKELLRS